MVKKIVIAPSFCIDGSSIFTTSTWVLRCLVDCVLGLPAEFTSRPIVVQTSSLVPAPNLDLNPNLFNPFVNTSHQINPAVLPNLTQKATDTKPSSYLEITKNPRKPPLVPLPPPLILSPNPTSSLITSSPLSIWLIC